MRPFSFASTRPSQTSLTSPRLGPHSRPPIEQISRETLKDADILGKILGWRNSKTTRSPIHLPSSATSLESPFRPTSKRTSSNARHQLHQPSKSSLNFEHNPPHLSPFITSSPLPHAPALAAHTSPASLETPTTSEFHDAHSSLSPLISGLGSEATSQDQPDHSVLVDQLRDPSLSSLARSQSVNKKPSHKLLTPLVPLSKPIVPFGNGVKLSRPHSPTGLRFGAHCRSIKKSLSSSDLDGYRKVPPDPLASEFARVSLLSSVIFERSLLSCRSNLYLIRSSLNHTYFIDRGCSTNST